MKEEEIKKQIAEILRDNIHLSPQLGTFVIHGAIEAIWKLMQEYAAQSAPKQSAGVWIKASERLPDKVGYYFCKDGKGKKNTCNLIESGALMREVGFDVVEWLDESQQLQSQQQPNLFQKKEVTLHSGEVSDFKIDCDALTDADLDCLAYLVSKQIKFGAVAGVPTGGIRFQKALEKYDLPDNDTLLICDDVISSGSSMEEMRKKFLEENKNIHGVVIFSRMKKVPSWIQPIFKMW